MNLFISDLPFHCWTDNSRSPPANHWSIRLQVIPSDAGLSQPPTDCEPQEWVLDTAFEGEAFAWHHHLKKAHVNPEEYHVDTVTLRSVLGTRRKVPVREADLWMVSNLSEREHPPFQLELNPGIAIWDKPAKVPDPNLHCALIGIGSLLRAGLKVEIDFDRRRISVWTPGSSQ